MKTIETLDGKLELMKWENGRLEIEVAHLKAENARYREALEYISEASWIDHPELNNAIDGDYLSDHFSEIAREALRGGK